MLFSNGMSGEGKQFALFGLLTALLSIQRRSSDGFVSATGMFRAAFPWAKLSEENIERDYLKELPSTAHDEVAGNVWVSEHYGTLGLSKVRRAWLTPQSYRAGC